MMTWKKENASRITGPEQIVDFLWFEISASQIFTCQVKKNVMFYDFITNILLFSRHSSIYATGYFQHKLDTSTQYAPLTVSAEILGLHMVDVKDNLSSLLAMKPNIKNIECKQNGDKFHISYLAQDCGISIADIKSIPQSFISQSMWSVHWF